MGFGQSMCSFCWVLTNTPYKVGSFGWSIIMTKWATASSYWWCCIFWVRHNVIHDTNSPILAAHFGEDRIVLFSKDINIVLLLNNKSNLKNRYITFATCQGRRSLSYRHSFNKVSSSRTSDNQKCSGSKFFALQWVATTVTNSIIYKLENWCMIITRLHSLF